MFGDTTLIEEQKLFKNAPFDVVHSKLQNTFFNRWDSIKNNVILNWVDVTGAKNRYGMALYSDHTTSYSYGNDFPLSLTLQYSGMGLWGMNYKIKGSSVIHYSIVPNEGNWDKALLNAESTFINEPLITAQTANCSKDGAGRSLLTSFTLVWSLAV
ncbi:hypothetical protein [Desertivirga arenae]|uniref:hypothetical protein n=1 Tax=Desertivirga arenae TaxID=2810309 RepID=UPI001A978E9E|nr:hypothetical protein [Pedobacter sp. SYSU D00823]